MVRPTVVLDHKVELLIPTKCICKKQIPSLLRKIVFEDTRGFMNSWFGGSTSIHEEGSYTMKDGSVVVEQNDRIESMCSQKLFTQHTVKVRKLATTVAEWLTQESIAAVFDGIMQFYPPGYKLKYCVHSSPSFTQIPTNKLSASVKPVPPKSKHTPLRIHALVRNFQALDHAKELFCNVLRYKKTNRAISWKNWPLTLRKKLLHPSRMIAQHQGFKIIHSCFESMRLNRGDTEAVIHQVIQDPEVAGLFLSSNRDQTEWKLIFAEITGARGGNPVIRELQIGPNKRVKATVGELLKLDRG